MFFMFSVFMTNPLYCAETTASIPLTNRNRVAMDASPLFRNLIS